MAEWFIVIIFAMSTPDIDAGRDMYIFTKPTYTDPDQCLADITDPQKIPDLMQKLFMEYGSFKPIEGVVCATKEEIENAIHGRTSA
jgi:hypothetical protein